MRCLGFDPDIGLQDHRQISLDRGDATRSMRFETTPGDRLSTRDRHRRSGAAGDRRTTIAPLRRSFGRHFQAQNAVPGDLPPKARRAKQDGGEDGIRTHEKLLASTPLAGERLRPLGHLSVAPLDKEKRRHNQQAGAIISENSAVLALPPPCGGDSEAIAWRPTRLRVAIRSTLCRIRPDSGAATASMVNESFLSEAKSCHLCNNVLG